MLTKPMKVGTWIALYMVLVVPFVLAMMAAFGNWSVAPFIYLALHGTYAGLWLIKESITPDRRFKEEKPAWIGFVDDFLPLAAYYVAPILLISRYVTPAPAYIALVLVIYVVGVYLQYGSDAQKFYTLRARNRLMTDGFFRRTRNPNYLGMILVYTALAMMAQHWLAFAILAVWIFGIYVPSMREKDRSMERYPEFPAYKARTWMLIPRFF